MQLWRRNRVIEETGLSKSTIYKLIADGTFPKSHYYSDIGLGVYWVSSEVERWKRDQLQFAGIDFDAVLG